MGLFGVSRVFFSSLIWDFPKKKTASMFPGDLERKISECFKEKENFFLALEALTSSMKPEASRSLIVSQKKQIESLIAEEVNKGGVTGHSSNKKAEVLLDFLMVCIAKKVFLAPDAWQCVSNLIISNFKSIKRKNLVKACLVYLRTYEQSFEKVFNLTIRHMVKNTKYEMTEKIYTALPLDSINQFIQEKPRKLKSFILLARNYFSRKFLSSFSSSSVSFGRIMALTLRENVLFFRRLAFDQRTFGKRQESLGMFFVDEITRQITSMEFNQSSKRKTVRTCILLHEAICSFVLIRKINVKNEIPNKHKDFLENLVFLKEFSLNSVLNNVASMNSKDFFLFLKSIRRLKARNTKTKIIMGVIRTKIKEKESIESFDIKNTRLLVELGFLSHFEALELVQKVKENPGSHLQVAKLLVTIETRRIQKQLAPLAFSDFQVNGEFLQESIQKAFNHFLSLDRDSMRPSELLSCIGCAHLMPVDLISSDLLSKFLEFLAKTHVRQLNIPTIILILQFHSKLTQAFGHSSESPDSISNPQKEMRPIIVSILRFCADHHRKWPNKSFIWLFEYLDSNGFLDFRIRDERELYMENLRMEIGDHYRKSKDLNEK